MQSQPMPRSWRTQGHDLLPTARNTQRVAKSQRVEPRKVGLPASSPFYGLPTDSAPTVSTVTTSTSTTAVGVSGAPCGATDRPGVSALGRKRTDANGCTAVGSARHL